jgi:hypothetical protein
MIRYSAKLLFQFRVVRAGTSARRRLCEERIVSLEASGPAAALAKAKKTGRSGEHDYRSANGGHVFFEFLGIIELIEMPDDGGEVWYEFVERLDPEKRLGALLPPEANLAAVRSDLPRRKRTPRL